MSTAASEEVAGQHKHQYPEIDLPITDAVVGAEFDFESSEKLKVLVEHMSEIGRLMVGYAAHDSSELIDYHPTHEASILGVSRNLEGNVIVSAAGQTDKSDSLDMAVECPFTEADWQLAGEGVIRVVRNNQPHTYTFRRWGDEYVVNDGRVLFDQNADDISNGRKFAYWQTWQARIDYEAPGVL